MSLADVAIQLAEVSKCPIALATGDRFTIIVVDRLSVTLDRVLLSVDLGAAWVGALITASNLDGDVVVSFEDGSSQVGKGWLCLGNLRRPYARR